MSTNQALPKASPKASPKAPQAEPTKKAKAATTVFLLEVNVGASKSMSVYSSEAVATAKYEEFYDMGCEVCLRQLELDPHLLRS